MFFDGYLREYIVMMLWYSMSHYITEEELTKKVPMCRLTRM